MPKARHTPQEDDAANDKALDPLAVERGQKLKHWLKSKEISPSQLARMSGLTEMAISKYVRGISDISRMQTSSITKLLTAMHVSDSWAWSYFLIPTELRANWRSMRPYPMGAADAASEVQIIVLDAPVQGEWVIPIGNLVTVEPQETDAGLQLAKVGTRYWLAKKEDLPSSAVRLGRFKAATLPE